MTPTPADERRVQITCPDCDGHGAVNISVAICCEQPTRTGECCGNPVEGQGVEPCSNCGGLGFFPDYTGAIRARKDGT